MNYSKLIYQTLSVVALACLSAATGYAQVNVTATGGTLSATYPTIADAVTQINAGTHTGTISVAVAAGHTEIAPTGGIALTATGTVGNPITIQKSGAGANPVITAYTGGTGTPGTAIQDGVFRLVGSDYVTIDGIDIAENAANTSNPATMEYGYALYKASATDGCQNNMIRNCVITLNRVNNAAGTAPMFDGSVGIYMGNAIPTTANAPLTITLATGTNSNNSFYSNTIQNCNIGIGLSGFTSGTPFTTSDTGNDIGGASAATGNTILNYGGGNTASPAAGVRVNQQRNINIAFNTINNNNGSGVNHATTLRGILLGTATSANANINNNNISLQSAGTTSLMEGISNGLGSTAASNTISINGNFVNLAYTTATSAVTNGIINGATPANLSISSNTVTAPSGLAGTGTLVMIETGSPVSATVTQNSVVNIVRTGASGAMRCIKATDPTTFICNNNLIDNISYTNLTSTGSINGIYGLSSSVDVTINGNIIRNLSTPTTGTITGIREWGSAGNKIVQNNQIYNFSTTAGGVGGASFDGIFLSVGTVTIASNQIYALNSTGTTGGTGGTVNGIQLGSSTVALANIYKNKVTNLSSTSTGVIVRGFVFNATTTNNIYNNIVGDLRAPAVNAANSLVGISIAGGTTANLYHNTVYLAGTSTGVNFGSSAILAVTGTNLTMNSNIFVNASTANGTGLAVAYRRSSATLTSYQASSNKNAFFASTIFTDGTNTDASFAAYQLRMGTRDALSINENPPFLSLVSTDANYLHINTTIATGVESGGAAIGTITDDFDGDVRFGNAGYTGSGFAVDMGADEFNGITNIAACSGVPAASNAVSSVTSTCPSAVINLSLSTSYTGTGITYQWQSSSDGTNYTNISGATAATTTATQTAATFYRAIVTCANSAQSITATPVSVVQSGAFFCYCATTYTNGVGTGDAVTNVRLNTLNNASTGAAAPYYTFFNTVTIPSITQNATETISVSFGSNSNQFTGVWIDYNQDGDFNDAGEFVANNTVTAGASGTAVLTFTVPLGALTGQTLMRVRGGEDVVLTNTPCGASSDTWGETEDYIVNIVATTACNGAPAASNAVSSVTSTCPSAVFNLSLSTAYTATGITYQWQSSSDGTNYTNISGATAATTTATQTAATFYRAIVTCANSGQSITATPVSVVQSGLFFCYCAPTYANGSGSGDEITNVRLNTLNNPSGAAPSPYYTFFNTATVPSITQNVTETISITLGNSGGDYVGVWIDYNQDGDFNDAGEYVVNSTVGSAVSGTFALNFTVPAGASLGQTLMRVRSAYNVVLTNTPCGATVSGFGEAEDYIVNIVAQTGCAGAPAASNAIASVTTACPSTVINLSLSTSYTAAGITYQWQSSPNGVTYTNISGATAATTTATQTAATFYRAIVTCANSAQSITATPVSVAQSGLFFCYCAPTYTTGAGGGDEITNVRLNTLNNTSGASASPYYTFFNTATIPSITQSATETISVTFGSDGAQFTGVWIDYNKDGDFNDAGEFVANSTVTAGASGTSVLTFVVPAGASLGQTLMRVRGGNDSQLTNTPCGASSSIYGETEDYIVNIVAPVACAVTASTTRTNVSCFGGSNGTATVVAANGTAPYVYAWSNGATAATAAGLTAGTYTVTVTDNAACTVSASATITAPAAALSASATSTNVSCNGGTNGTATVAVTGGTTPYAFAWSNGATAATAVGLTAGTYAVTATDNNGCVATASATITAPTALSASATSTNVSCNGGANGTATVAVTGGTTPYAFAWSNGATSATAAGLTAGAYTVTATDNNGCVATASATITAPAALSASATSTNVSCNGGSNGTATVAVTGGTTPYAFAWSNGATAATAAGLTAGAYTVTATDNNGCVATASATITAPAALSASATSTNVSCNGGSNGTTTVAVTGGTTPYAFAWSNGATAATNAGLSAGIYAVTATDNNGCVATASATITEPTALAATTSVNNVTCNGNSDGMATIIVSGGTSPYMYAWSNGATASTAANLVAGTYNVTVTDDNGCVFTASTTVTQPAVFTLAASSTNPTSCVLDNGTATATTTNGIAPFSFVWSNNATTATINNLAAGSFSVTATDDNGCVATASTSLNAPNGVTLSFPSGVSTACFGGNNANISVTATGATAPYSFAWSNGATTQTVSGVSAGTYSVTVTAANGCDNNGSLVVSEPTQLVAATTSVDATCLACADGTATATSTGGTGAVTFVWSDGQTTATATGLLPATYTVTVTDANGCSATSSVVVTGTINVTEPTAQAAIRLFPNPTANIVSIDGLTAGARLTVLNGLGQVVQVIETQNTIEQINLSDLAPAVYFIRIESGQQQMTLPVVLAK